MIQNGSQHYDLKRGLILARKKRQKPILRLIMEQVSHNGMEDIERLK
jgi:hypothetical protein